MRIDKYSAESFGFSQSLLSKSGCHVKTIQPDFSSPVIFPVRYFCRKDLTVLCVPPELADSAAPDLSALFSLGRKYAEENGYTPDRFFDLCLRFFADPDGISDCIRPDTLRLTGDESFRLLGDVAADIKGGQAVFGTVVDGTVVSASGAHTDGDICLLWAETAPDFRSRGYAASNAAACARHYLSLGYTVLYECREINIASRRTAQKAGFLPHSKFASLAARR